MNRQPSPPCARVAERDPGMADRMWNTVTGPDGRDRIDEAMRTKGRALCAECPMRLECIGRALVNGWKDKSLYGGLDYWNRWTLARMIANDLNINVKAIHRLRQRAVSAWLAAHPDWDRRMRGNGTGYWRNIKRRQRARRTLPPIPPDRRPAEPVPTGMVQGSLF